MIKNTEITLSMPEKIWTQYSTEIALAIQKCIRLAKLDPSIKVKARYTAVWEETGDKKPYDPDNPIKTKEQNNIIRIKNKGE